MGNSDNLIENPWHRLGKVFGPGTSIAEVIEKVCPWQVLEFAMFNLLDSATELYQADETGKLRKVYVNDTLLVNDYKTLRRSDTLERLHVCPSSYQIVQNPEAFLWADRLVRGGFLEIDSAVVLDGGAKILICCRLPADRSTFLVGEEDALELKAMLATSHDGKLALLIGCVAYHVASQSPVAICTKGKVLTRGEYHSFRHTLNISISAARQYLRDMQSIFQFDTVPLYRRLRDMPLTDTGLRAYAKQVLKVGDAKLKTSQAWKRVFELYHHSPALQNLPHSYYRGYLAFAHYWGQHAGTSTDESCAARLKSNLFGDHRTKNQSALAIALQKLK